MCRVSMPRMLYRPRFMLAALHHKAVGVEHQDGGEDAHYDAANAIITCTLLALGKLARVSSKDR